MVHTARADILVRTDGSLAEGKVVIRDSKQVVFLPDGIDPSAAEHIDIGRVSRLLATDEHGSVVTDRSPTTQPASASAATTVPPEPAPPPLLRPTAGPTYYVIPLHGQVGVTVLAAALEKSLADAAARKPTVVVLDIDSPSGLVDEAQKTIAVLHRYNKLVRIVALTNQDLSAAAVISLSAREIYVKSTSTIGAATSYIPGNPNLSAKIEEKMQSAWRAVARNSAEEGGHEPLLADAMIDNTLSLHVTTLAGKPVVAEGAGPRQLCRPGMILTLTSHEAVACGLAAGAADDINELGVSLKLPKWTECKGLGTLLAAYLPQRSEALQREMDQVAAHLVHDIDEAIRTDPSQAVVTVNHATLLPHPGRQLRSPSDNPHGPAPARTRVPAGIPGRSVTTTVRHSHAHWKSESLACVVALQNAEADLKQAMSVCNAFGETTQAESIQGALDQISAIRARVYDDRNQYGLTDAAPQAPAASVPTTNSSGLANGGPLPGPHPAPLAPGGGAAPDPAAGPHPPASGSTECVTLIKPAQDTRAGIWTADADGLTSSGHGLEVSAVPFKPADEYDISANFTRHSGDEDIAVILQANGSKFMFIMGGWHNRVIGADMVGKARANGVPDSIRGNDLIPLNHASNLEIKVRKTSLEATVNGMHYHIATDYAGWNLNNDWRSAADCSLGVATLNSSVTFQSFRVTNVKGQGNP